MKKLTLSILLIAAVKLGSAQFSLTFCENVNKDGRPAMASNSFAVNKAGSALKFLFKADDKLNTDQMDFKVFYINDAGHEEEISKLPQQVDPHWNYVWKEVVFFDPGNYRVKVYNKNGLYLTSANLNVKQLQ